MIELSQKSRTNQTQIAYKELSQLFGLLLHIDRMWKTPEKANKKWKQQSWKTETHSKWHKTMQKYIEYSNVKWNILAIKQQTAEIVLVARVCLFFLHIFCSFCFSFNFNVFNRNMELCGFSNGGGGGGKKVQNICN